MGLPSRSIELIGCTVGIMGFFVFYGFLQEKLMTRPYADPSDPDYEHSKFFFFLCSFLFLISFLVSLFSLFSFFSFLFSLFSFLFSLFSFLFSLFSFLFSSFWSLSLFLSFLYLFVLWSLSLSLFLSSFSLFSFSLESLCNLLLFHHLYLLSYLLIHFSFTSFQSLKTGSKILLSWCSATELLLFLWLLWCLFTEKNHLPMPLLSKTSSMSLSRTLLPLFASMKVHSLPSWTKQRVKPNELLAFSL